MTGPHSQGRDERPSDRATAANMARDTQVGPEGYNTPQTYRDIDSPAPSPLHSDSAHNGLPQSSSYSMAHAQTHTTPEARPQTSTTSDDYDVPDSYVNLDEVADVSPIQNPHEEPIHRYESLEGVRSRDQERIRLEKSLSRQRRESVGVEQAEGKKDKRGRVSKLATQIYTISYLILFSILGTLARLGLQALVGNYPGAPVIFPSLWPNFAGCLVMGFLTEDCKIFRHAAGDTISATSPHPTQNTNTPTIKPDEETGTINNSPSSSSQQDQTDTPTPTPSLPHNKKAHTALKKTIPLYIGLATGFCGSFTSFSSFIRDAFLALSNDLSPVPSIPTPHPRNPGYSLSSLLAVLLLTLSLSLSALFLGAHLAIALSPILPSLPPRSRPILDRSAVVLATCAWLAAVFLCIFPPDADGGEAPSRGALTLALALAPPGCLLRFYLSLRLNGRVARFPLGTFAANILGTLVLGVAWDVARIPAAGVGVVSCQVLQGVQDGFCGCLTTVSTWVGELAGLRRRNAYVYGGVSVGVGLGMLVAVMGGLRWGVGWGEVRCVHGIYV